MVEEGGDVGAALAGDGFHPDVLVGGDFWDFPLDGDALHDGGGGEEDGGEDLGGGEPGFFHVGDAIAPREGDVAAGGEIFRRDESGFEEPGVGEDHAGVELVGDEPDLDFWGACWGVGGDGVFLDELDGWCGGGGEGDEVTGGGGEDEGAEGDGEGGAREVSGGFHLRISPPLEK